jgi:hypothetical protein
MGSRALRTALAFSALLTPATATAGYPAGQRPPSLEPFLTNSKADEMALALTAAPRSITSNATIMTLGRRGYDLARKGNNGFVCMIERSWATNVSDSEFWNVRVRQPACYNPVAVRSILPTYLERTRWVLAGASISQIEARTRTAVARGHIRPPEPGTLIYMMSKQGYLGDVLSKHPHPHLMFFLPKRGPEALGANLTGVPIFSVDGEEQPFSIFFVLVPKWSDGSPAPSIAHADH